ncbi:MAG: acyl carrier protein [Atopostipes suicloacalis]|nr:acyl carrier protein [Atopostipes suicloacalis]
MIKDTVIEIIAEQLEVEKESITPSTNFAEDLEADSLDIFQVLSEIEDELDMIIETDENIETVQELIDHIEKIENN